MVKFVTEGLILLGLVLLQNNFGVGAYFTLLYNPLDSDV